MLFLDARVRTREICHLQHSIINVSYWNHNCAWQIVNSLQDNGLLIRPAGFTAVQRMAGPQPSSKSGTCSQLEVCVSSTETHGRREFRPLVHQKSAVSCHPLLWESGWLQFSVLYAHNTCWCLAIHRPCPSAGAFSPSWVWRWTTCLKKELDRLVETVFSSACIQSTSRQHQQSWQQSWLQKCVLSKPSNLTTHDSRPGLL